MNQTDSSLNMSSVLQLIYFTWVCQSLIFQPKKIVIIHSLLFAWCFEQFTPGFRFLLFFLFVCLLCQCKWYLHYNIDLQLYTNVSCIDQHDIRIIRQHNSKKMTNKILSLSRRQLMRQIHHKIKVIFDLLIGHFLLLYVLICNVLVMQKSFKNKI